MTSHPSKPKLRWQFGQFSLRWLFSACTGAGTIDESGAFKASTNVGVFEDGITARASFKGTSGTGIAKVTVKPDLLDHIELSSPLLILGAGEQQQLSVTARDKYENITMDVGVSWAVKAGGGNVDGLGLFTAGSEIDTFNDTVEVKVTQGQTYRQATATVLVKPQSLSGLSAATATLAPSLDLTALSVNWRPTLLPLSSAVPSQVFAAPDPGTGNVLFGSIRFGETTMVPVAIHVIGDQYCRVYLDRNQNGSLTEDPTFPCVGTTTITTEVAYITGPKFYTFKFYGGFQDPPQFRYYRGGAWVGTIDLKGLRKIALLDDNANGQFNDFATDYMVIDVNGDGSLDGSSGGEELYRLNQVFTIGGEDFKVTTVSADGNSVTIGSSDLGVLSGSVQSLSTAEGIPNANVVVQRGSVTIREIIADVNGNFALNVLEGDYDLSISAWGYRTRTSKASIIPGTVWRSVFVVRRLKDVELQP